MSTPAETTEAEATALTPATNVPELSGPSSAAVLLMAMGEDNAANVLRRLGPEEVQAIGTAMTDIGTVSQAQIGVTLDSFIHKVEMESTLGVAPDHYLYDTLKRALGAERAVSVMSQINKDSVAPTLEALKWMPNRMVAKLIGEEHPQFIAIVMSYLDRDKASAVLEELPPTKQADIVVRVTRLKTIHPTALKEIDTILEQRFGENFEMELAGAGGIETVAEILNGVSTDQEALIMEALTELDAELASSIREKMFVFENLLAIDDRGIQALLRDVSSDSLIKALKGSTVEVKTKILKNMSSRAAAMLEDDLESKGPMRLVEVEEAQKEILVVAQKMAEEGKINLGGKGDDFV